MASESEVNEMNTFLERLITSRDNRDRELSLFIPFLLGFTTLTDPGMTRPELGEAGSDPDHISVNNTDPDDRLSRNRRDRIIMVNPLARGMYVVIEGNGLDSLLRGAPGKDGPPPASRSSIETMPSVVIGEGEEGACVICLEEWGVGENGIKEMPCKHMFHGGCIEKWLGLHGSCPVCRFSMPVEDDEPEKKGEDERDGEERNDIDDEEERRRRQREIWVRFMFGNGRRRNDENIESGSGLAEPVSQIEPAGLALGSGPPVSQTYLTGLGSGLSEPVNQIELTGSGSGLSGLVNQTEELGSGSGENDHGHNDNEED